MLWVQDTYDYIMMQYEVGEEGTPHLHAVVHYKKAISFGRMQKKYERAHIEVVGHWDKCVQYCSKEDTRSDGPYEWGEPPKQGKRSDLEQIAQVVSEGMSNHDIALINPVWILKFRKHIDDLRNTLFLPREPDNKMKVLWFYGASGTGKSKSAWSYEGTKYMKDNTKWWNGYCQQDVIIIDDFDCWGEIGFRQLLRITDRYPMGVELKGGYIELNSKVLIITCEHHPSKAWKDNELKQITRRIDEIKQFL